MVYVANYDRKIANFGLAWIKASQPSRTWPDDALFIEPRRFSTPGGWITQPSAASPGGAGGFRRQRRQLGHIARDPEDVFKPTWHGGTPDDRYAFWVARSANDARFPDQWNDKDKTDPRFFPATRRFAFGNEPAGGGGVPLNLAALNDHRPSTEYTERLVNAFGAAAGPAHYYFSTDKAGSGWTRNAFRTGNAHTDLVVARVLFPEPAAADDAPEAWADVGGFSAIAYESLWFYVVDKDGAHALGANGGFVRTAERNTDGVYKPVGLCAETTHGTDWIGWAPDGSRTADDGLGFGGAKTMGCSYNQKSHGRFSTAAHRVARDKTWAAEATGARYFYAAVFVHNFEGFSADFGLFWTKASWDAANQAAGGGALAWPAGARPVPTGAYATPTLPWLLATGAGAPWGGGAAATAADTGAPGGLTGTLAGGAAFLGHPNFGLALDGAGAYVTMPEFTPVRDGDPGLSFSAYVRFEEPLGATEGGTLFHCTDVSDPTNANFIAMATRGTRSDTWVTVRADGNRAQEPYPAFGIQRSLAVPDLFEHASCGTRATRWLVGDPAWVVGRSGGGDSASEGFVVEPDDPTDGDVANLRPAKPSDGNLFDGNFMTKARWDHGNTGDGGSLTGGGCNDWALELDLGAAYDIVGFMFQQNGGGSSGGLGNNYDAFELHLQHVALLPPSFRH